MSLRPIDMQVAIAKTQELTKPNEITGDKFVLQGAYKEETEKNVEKHMTEVNKSSEMEKLDENGHNKQEKSEKDEEQLKKRLMKRKQKEEEDYKRKVTNQGNLFDFEA